MLSGGEKSRLAIAKMLLRPANFICMDEPTNHLDIPSREVLTDALEEYDGTLCFITHDLTLVRQIANRIIALNSGNLEVFNGNYDGYLEWKNAPAANGSEATKTQEHPTKETPVKLGTKQRKQIDGELRHDYYRGIAPVRKRIAEIEDKLAKTETELKEITQLFSDEAHYNDSKQVVEAIDRHGRLKKLVATLTDEWEKLSLEAEKMKREFKDAIGKI